MKPLLLLLASMMVILVMAPLFATSPSPLTKATLIKSTLALNWVPEPEFGGFYAAQELGLYRKRGIDLKIVPGGVGTPTIQMVAAKKVEFGISSAAEVIIARSRGAKVVAFFAVYQKSPLGIMVHESRGLKSIKDVFESGTLSIERGQGFSKFLEKKYGYSKIKIVPYIGGVGPFLRDPQFAQQCFIFSEPVIARRQGAKPQVFLVADAGYNPYIEVIVTHEDTLKANPQLIEALFNASREGWKSYLKDPQPTNRFMAGLNRAMDIVTFNEGAKAQAPLIEMDNLTVGTMTLERMKETAEQLLDLGLLKKIEDPSRTFVSFK